MILNPDLKLNNEEEYNTTREGGGQGFLVLGETNERVIALTADLPTSARLVDFSKKYPDRYFNLGVAEQNMAGVGAGLALSGKIVYITSFAVFSPGRNWDQIRVNICYSKANVKIVSAETGLSVGYDGASHQGMEDIAMMRVLPNITVIAPCDFEEAKKTIIEASKIDGPVYIRYCKTNVRTYTTPSTPFEIGKSYIYSEGADVSIFNTGLLLEQCLKAKEELEKEGINAEVIHVPTIKPLDTETIIGSLQKTGCGVSVEDHQIAGGLGSAILEESSKYIAVPFERVGMNDSFGESGKAEDLLEKYSINVKTIVEKARSVISRKNHD